MWYSVARFILKNRIGLLGLLFAGTCIMGYYASKVQLSYEFTRAIPTDNPKYQEFESFKQRFGDNGGLLVVGIESNNFYSVKNLQALLTLSQQLKKIRGVESVLSVADALNLVRNDSTDKLETRRIFPLALSTQQQADSGRAIFENLPFYNGLLYNPSSKAYLVGMQVNKGLINSDYRTVLVSNILKEVEVYQKTLGNTLHISGLPFIRTTLGDMVKKEMKYFLIGSLLLSAITLLIFFRSFSAMLMSLVVVVIGVIFSVGTIVIAGYKITLLTALIPPLVVVIGIPNCIYFLNKYHTSLQLQANKQAAIINMVGRMGIVTLFCNIAAAIGFAVFALTKSALLQEFGLVAGINIMLLFGISLVFIPSVLSYLPLPGPAQLRYLDNRLLMGALQQVERWTVHHKRLVLIVTLAITGIAVAGIFRLKSEGFIVDDLPKTAKIYTDLKWFESNFGGVMPLEVVIDTKKKNGVTSSLRTFDRVDEFSNYLQSRGTMSRPLTVVEGLKFVKQAYYDGDSLSYAAPSEFDMPFLAPYLKSGAGAPATNASFNNLLNGFIDSNKQYTRMSITMKDVGSVQLPIILDTLQQHANQIFDTANYDVQFTGASVTFLEGSRFIINGLKESILWAFLLIALCMLYLFKSVRILFCSLIPNVVPLAITAGVMGWVGISLKPSTVLVFSVALGIAIDVTIRFLVNYKQELPANNNNVEATLLQTIRHTGISIIYTSLVLIAGFIIFCFSGFGGTQALGWLTSLTLVVGTITNLVLLPVLLTILKKK